MANKILPGLGPVSTQQEHQFGMALAKVLSPAQPLQSEEFLRGRAEQLAGIKQALYQQGRHVLIHGLRGVGKSSLAQTAAFGIAAGASADPIVIGCDTQSSFGSVVRDIFDEAAAKSPLVIANIKQQKVEFAKFGITLGSSKTMHEGQINEPSSVNEAVRLMKFLSETYADQPVVIIDEFDQIVNRGEQELFTNFIKQISDKHISSKFIFCGLGESVDAIMAAHGSADRYFHTVNLGQLPWEARFEIVKFAANKLEIEIDETTIIRIARISDGFPHYVHFISEKLFWRVFHAENGGKVTAPLFEQAMADAADAMEMRLKGPYETATQKYSDDYKYILWAAADGHELKRRSTDIFGSYNRIMKECSGPALSRTQFNQRINRLKQPAHGSILTGTRQGWYEYTEKVIRGFVRLKAEQDNVSLQPDHPIANRLSTST